MLSLDQTILEKLPLGNIIFTAIVLIVLWLVNLFCSRAIKSAAGTHRIKLVRKKKLIKVINLITLIIGGSLIIGVWGVSPYDIWLVFSAVLGFMGIALFAGWSILSSLSAAFLIYFNNFISIGDSIEVLDGDNSISGTVDELTLFFIRVTREDGSTAQIPNNFIFLKPLLKGKNPKNQKKDLTSKI